ncbi:MAG: ABC transporter ATP-binding protein [Xanthomonadales bacterium]|nr:ABC transporter ATP-binding protein [Xanthomonadales bacterium]
MLDVDELTVSFGGVRAVSDVSFSLGEGATVGIIGPNGAGKTTLVNALTGMVEASGSVSVDGEPLRLGRPGPAYHAGIVRTYQTPRTFAGLSCLENVIVGMGNRARTGLSSAWFRRPSMLEMERGRWARAEEILRGVNLGSVAETDAGELSYGRQRLLELGRAIAAEPRLILLDEPAAGLNGPETDALADLILDLSTRGVGLLVIEHKLDFVTRVCPEVIVLDLGRAIAAGPTQEVFRDPQVMDAYLGTSADA